MENSKGCITVIQESSTYFKTQERILHNISSPPVVLLAESNSDLCALHSWISFFTMWSGGSHLEFVVVLGYKDLLILIRMPD